MADSIYYLVFNLAILFVVYARVDKRQVNVVVSKQGDGDATTLSDAVKNIPSIHRGRYVIYVKRGLYEENVVISQSNITLLGDGKGATIISSNKSAKGGFRTQDTATVVILGENFIAQDITFENTAGPENKQAVALRCEGDRAVFYLCEFRGYQDTLYVDSGRQFFRQCDILGTIDFIFGDASVVLQNCAIKFRQPLPHQRNVVTAQGRDDKNSKTGIVIHNCTIDDDKDVRRNSVQCFLGRPWKMFSRTVVMQSFISDVVHPKGWLEWHKGLHLDTLEYREFDNRGAGSANGKRRVQWPGYKLVPNAEGVKQFTVAAFINGDVWLPATGVPFTLDFI